jgi:hypothetical protein
MKLSEFQRAVTDEFGSGYGQALLTDLVLGELGGRTAQDALNAGTPALVRRGQAGPETLATRRGESLEDMFGTG